MGIDIMYINNLAESLIKKKGTTNEGKYQVMQGVLVSEYSCQATQRVWGVHCIHGLESMLKRETLLMELSCQTVGPVGDASS